MSSTEASSPPPRQYLGAENVLGEMAAFGTRRLEQLSLPQVLVLAVLAGGFITVGALFSVLLSQGIEAEGPRRLAAGIGFSAGFFFVVLSEAALFTEANVVLPAVLLRHGRSRRLLGVVRFWVLAWAGNLVGALLVGFLVIVAQEHSAGVREELAGVVHHKLAYARQGTAAAWGAALLSGVLANWLVGMAAFFATMGRTIVGKYVPVALAVTLFVAADFQHSPANMGYFALAEPAGVGGGWTTGILWNILPVGIGNMIGGALLVVVPFWYALRPGEKRAVAERSSA